MMTRLLLTAVLFGLTACATPYGKMSLMGGVEAQQIDERIVRVSARGNAFTDIARVRDYALLKAAQVTLDNKYRYFAVVQGSDASTTGTIASGGSSTTYTTGSVHAFGNTATGSATSQTYYTPRTYTNFVKPGQDVYIRMFAEDELTEEQKASVFDAQSIMKFLGSKYLKKKR